MCQGIKYVSCNKKENVVFHMFELNFTPFISNQSKKQNKIEQKHTNDTLQQYSSTPLQRYDPVLLLQKYKNKGKNILTVNYRESLNLTLHCYKLISGVRS
jgi:hypothetical protein